MGYYRAGYDVIGVDICLQTHYPFPYIIADAISTMELLLNGKTIYASNGVFYKLDDFDTIHASPVCKGYSILSNFTKRKYPDDIPAIRELLIKSRKKYSIENVVGAPLKNYVMLCGSMFGLKVYRHRLFECNPMIAFSPGTCRHWGKVRNWRKDNQIDGKHKYETFDTYDVLTVVGKGFSPKDGRIAMGINWMTGNELSQAIPPAYTEYIGKCLLALEEK